MLGEHRHLLYAITDPAPAGCCCPPVRATGGSSGLAYGAGGDVGRAADRTRRGQQRLLRAIGPRGSRGAHLQVRSFSSPVRSWRSGSRADRLFLIGDAAHRVTPRGGTGLNVALADGHDLGWKLGWVLRGWARPPCWPATRPNDDPPRSTTSSAPPTRRAPPAGGLRDPRRPRRADRAPVGLARRLHPRPAPRRPHAAGRRRRPRPPGGGGDAAAPPVSVPCRSTPSPRGPSAWEGEALRWSARTPGPSPPGPRPRPASS